MLTLFRTATLACAMAMAVACGPVMAQVNSAPSLGNVTNSQLASDRAADQSQMSQYDAKTLDINKTRTAFSAIAADKQVARMGRGINILSSDSYWQDSGPGNYKDKAFKTMRNAGFATVRVNLRAFDHMGPEGELDRAWLKKVDWIVDAAQKYKMTVILEEHESDLCSKDARSCGILLRALWRQLAAHYQNESNLVVFELLDEPHGELDAATWNTLTTQLLAVIRQTNPERNVIVTPTRGALGDLGLLTLPEDDAYLIVSFHYYNPLPFTHQGAAWAPVDIAASHDVTFGTAADVARINSDFDTVRSWAAAHSRPVLLGEFGAYDKAPMDSRIAWTTAVARAAESHGFAWAYWQLSGDFGIYDFGSQQFNAPLLTALVPGGKK